MTRVMWTVGLAVILGGQAAGQEASNGSPKPRLLLQSRDLVPQPRAGAAAEKPRSKLDAEAAAKAAMVHVEVWLAELAPGAPAFEPQSWSGPSDGIAARLSELQQQGKIQSLSHLQLAALANQSAYVHFGERRPVISGHTAMPVPASVAGRSTPPSVRSATSISVVEENVGTIVGVTPRVVEEGDVLMEIDVEQSQLAATPESATATDGGFALPPGTATTSCQSTVRVATGQTVLVGGMEVRSEDAARTILILAAARVVEK